MNRLLYDVSRWHLYQHRSERRLPLARDNDQPVLKLQDELYERLYAGEADALPERQVNAALRPWAESIHESASALPAFTRLAADCRGDAAAAATAVETIMAALGSLPSPHQPPPEQKPGPNNDPLRRPLIAACAAATKAVEELRDATEGLALVGWGTQHADPRTAPADPNVRPLAARLRDDARLKRIALLAGRMKRIAASKRRQRVKHGADEITDVEQGADLGRALPVELGKLQHPALRLDFMRSLLERQLLQYQLTGTDTLGRGPIVIVLDKSGSMDGPRDIWATALALALLEHAHAEGRRFALIDFNYGVTYEAIVRPGDVLPHDALFQACGGGTDIARALNRGLDLIAIHSDSLRKADLVLITDGGSDTDQAKELRAKARARNVSILGLSIGIGADVLTPWCDEAHGVHNLDTIDPQIATALFSA